VSLNNSSVAGKGQDVKVKFTLQQVTKAQRGNRGIALSLTSTLDGCGRSKLRPGCFNPWNDPVSIVWEAGWVWTGAENLEFRSPDRPARS